MACLSAFPFLHVKNDKNVPDYPLQSAKALFVPRIDLVQAYFVFFILLANVLRSRKCFLFLPQQSHSRTPLSDVF
jgi:hypothetical protein